MCSKKVPFLDWLKNSPFFLLSVLYSGNLDVHLLLVPLLNSLSHFIDNPPVKSFYAVMPMKYAFAYLRVSTEEQTVQNQKMALEKWAKQNSYQLLDFFEDSAVSGRVPATQRRGFQEMLELVKTAEVDAVLVYELSRVGRTFWDTLDAIKAVEQYAALISCSPRESFLQMTEPSVRKLMIGILTWVAEREREMLVQRTKDGMERAKASGKSIGRPLKVIDKNRLIIMLAENHSRAKIARNLGVSKGTLYKELRHLR
jgi:putative DNA-invertase from lambdoid prophage Rac